ncbi:hypothetical protein [Celeribacter baekdonensis]|uniref:hypothetical protein n=1 Tax=Celeribacter baekdonensis TaxID=875171 RepID=UPI0030DA696B|tara:strand:- start:14360 stop:14614 length:255 start_codon:yes stop_codon:yes gene_type:complete
MQIEKITEEIDREILSRSSDKFGIKVGGELYIALAEAQKIKKATFSALGTGAFPEELPAYDGKYFIYHDWELGDWDFKVGVPTD